MKRRSIETFLVEREEEEPSRGTVMGRPPIYDPLTTPERAYRLCLIGLTDEQLAVAFGVSVQCIDRWKRTHEEFYEAVHRGKEEADSVVAQSLFHRAKGYKCRETVVKVINDQIETVDIEKQYPPDTTACIFWLKNRQRQNWRDVWNLEHSGKDGKPIEMEAKQKLAHLDLSDLPDDVLELVAAIGVKITRSDKSQKLLEGSHDVVDV